ATYPDNVTGDGVANHGISHVITSGRVQPSWSELLVEASSHWRPHFHVAIRTTSFLPTPECQSREGPGGAGPSLCQPVRARSALPTVIFLGRAASRTGILTVSTPWS